MLKITDDLLLKAIPSHSDVSITQSQLALRFGLSQASISVRIKLLVEDGRVEKFRVYGSTIHYRQTKNGKSNS
jgi:DNA-binding Lrp family transcriptional regulator